MNIFGAQFDRCLLGGAATGHPRLPDALSLFPFVGARQRVCLVRFKVSSYRVRFLPERRSLKAALLCTTITKPLALRMFFARTGT